MQAISISLSAAKGRIEVKGPIEEFENEVSQHWDTDKLRRLTSQTGIVKILSRFGNTLVGEYDRSKETGWFTKPSK